MYYTYKLKQIKAMENFIELADELMVIFSQANKKLMLWKDTDKGRVLIDSRKLDDLEFEDIFDGAFEQILGTEANNMVKVFYNGDGESEELAATMLLNEFCSVDVVIE